jgi:hypothetical protein
MDAEAEALGNIVNKSAESVSKDQQVQVRKHEFPKAIENLKNFNQEHFIAVPGGDLSVESVQSLSDKGPFKVKHAYFHPANQERDRAIEAIFTWNHADAGKEKKTALQMKADVADEVDCQPTDAGNDTSSGSVNLGELSIASGVKICKLMVPADVKTKLQHVDFLTADIKISASTVCVFVGDAKLTWDLTKLTSAQHQIHADLFLRDGENFVKATAGDIHKTLEDNSVLDAGEEAKTVQQ